MVPPPRLHVVTDDAVLRGDRFVDVATAVLESCGPEVALHVRGHATTGRVLHDVAVALADAALRTGAWLLVNDRIDIALAARANGVQLGRRSIPVADARTLLGAGARIGLSVHTAAEAAEAVVDGADFVVLGTIYATSSHAGRPGAGTVLVQEAAARAAPPVIAIGGITPGRVAGVAEAGGWGVAVLGGVWRAGDPAAAAAAYVSSIRSAGWRRER